MYEHVQGIVARGKLSTNELRWRNIFFYDLACGLVELGHQVTLYAAPGSRAPEPNGQVRVVPGGYGQISPAGEYAVWDWYKDELLAADLIISGSHGHYESEQIYFWHRDARGKVLNVLNGLVTHVPRPCFNMVLGSEKWKQLSLAGHTQFRGTPWEAQYGATMDPMPPEAVAGVIPWATNAAFYTPVDDPKSDYLLYAGRPTPYKGWYLALEVAERTRIPLKALLGVGQAEHAHWAQRFEEEAARLRKGDVDVERVQIPENAHHHELKRELYRHAKALLFPVTSHEPFGLVPIESMSCGTPVIASNLGAMPEIIVEGISGFTRPVLEYSPVDKRWLGKSDGLVEAVGQLDRIDRKLVRVQAVAHFDRRLCAERYVQLAKSLA